ncbi:hypothetical protein MMC13_001780 [Lambiella insularis]|nr:hypothetical protein [Lambiella insularis]
MPIWTDLPNEVVVMIVSVVDGRKTLAAISRVCKVLHKIAEPMLYRRLEVEWDNDTGLSLSVHKLLRSFLGRPELALQVHHVTFENHCDYITEDLATWSTTEGLGQFRSIWEYGNRLEFSKLDWELANNFIHAAELSDATSWIEGLRQGRVDVFVALVLAHLQDLQYLRLHIDLKIDAEFIREVVPILCLERGLIGAQRLSKLQAVHLSQALVLSDVTDDISNDELVLPLFYLPSIKDLRVSLGDPHVWAWPQQEAPLAYTLRKLYLHASTLREAYLIELFVAAPNLREFRYEKVCDEQYKNNGFPTLELGTLRKALKTIGSTLEELAICVSLCADFDSPDNIRIDGDLGTLLIFKKLHRVEIAPRILLGRNKDSLVKRLPGSIGEFVLTFDTESIWGDEWNDPTTLKALREYLQGWRTHTPHLKQITLNLVRHRSLVGLDRWSEATRTELQSLCDSADVECVINLL